ncbi:MAG: competence/damage-inducible protein A [Candidatus Omnitrophica bacterium]|nr:competence/damage-inducible protein A [Candidatus Omnitrophota bacterium]
MQAELITIGAELLNGATVNTNAAYLARRLAQVGLCLVRQTTVSDEPSQIAAAVQEAFSRSEIVLTTGGLGPTFDDTTLSAIAQATQQPLVFCSKAAANVQRFYSQAHRKLKDAAWRQAWLPEKAVALPNPLGTACGIWLSWKGGLLICLPGVPREMQVILEQSVLPGLKKHLRSTASAYCLLRTVGLFELSIEAFLQRLRLPEGLTVGLYPHLRLVDIGLSAQASSAALAKRHLNETVHALCRHLGKAVYGTNGDTLESIIAKEFIRRHWTLAVAESCTGGLLSDTLTNVPGSSGYFRGSTIAYHNDVKLSQLKVSRNALKHQGAVSATVAQQTASGIRELLHAKIGLSITGIAGPKGGSPSKPVGLVFIGLADGRTIKSRRFQFTGDRISIKWQAVQTALDWLRQECAIPPSGISASTV